MQRLLMEKLAEWKTKRNRKPLLLFGARQVGKTWLMKEFGKTYFAQAVYISFDNNPRMKHVFEMDFDLSRILSALQVESRMIIHPETTLLIFDEIQEVPRALTCLKYFCEQAPEYAIVAAGSLLGVALHHGTSFPVGKVDFLQLHPLNYREFLMATHEEALAELLIQGDYELLKVFADKYTDLLRKYYYVGGMPEAVNTYVETDDFYEVQTVQRNLLTYYENDFSKHAPTTLIPRIRMVWDSIPMQLAKENKKFIFGMVRDGGRAKDFELAVQWLLDCGLLHKSHRVRKPGMPLKAYLEMNSFKLYFLDIGLLSAQNELDARTLLEGNRIFSEFKGALTEQFVAQELVAGSHSLYYYSTENSSGEIDFVLQKNGSVIPIEVKAEENLHAKSLRSYCQKNPPEKAIRTSMSNYREQDWMTNVPLYLLSEFFNIVQSPSN